MSMEISNAYGNYGTAANNKTTQKEKAPPTKPSSTATQMNMQIIYQRSTIFLVNSLLYMEYRPL